MKNVIRLFSILFLVGGVVFNSCKKDDPVKVTGVSLSETSLSMAVGDTKDLTATVTPSDAKDKSVVWSSDDEAVAKVDANGKVTAVGEGKTTISVKTVDGNFDAKCKVEVALKMEDNFDTEVKASLKSANNVFNLIANDIMTFDTSGSFLDVNDKLILSVKNTSGKVIPAGTQWKIRFKRNGRDVDFVYVGVAGNKLEKRPLTTEGTLEKNLGIGESFILHEEEFFLHRKTYGDNWGSNSFCVELVQFGKTAYPTAKSNCYDFSITGK